jgi:hypothetical protein
MYLDMRTTDQLEPATAAARREIARSDIDLREAATPKASPLFSKLMTSVNRRRLLLDRCYFQLVSEIAELLCDEEVALLALYLAPPLAVGIPSKERRLALSIMRNRKKGKADA